MNWQHQLGTLTIARSIAFYARHPGKAIATDRREWRKFFAYRKARREGLAQLYEHYPRTSIPPDFADLWQLYALVRQNKPGTIVEIGGGCSTVALSYALERNGTGILICVDESEYWQSVIRDYLPESLRRRCEFIAREPVATNGISRIPGVVAPGVGMIYVDGGNAPGSSVNDNAVDLEKDAAPDLVIVVDGRKKTVDYLKANLSRTYRIAVDAEGHQTIFSAVSSGPTADQPHSR